MSSSFYKRKYAGPPVQELRQVDQDPLKVAPHKKPRKYRLTMTYTRVHTKTLTKDFPSKAAMQEQRARIERILAEVKAGKRHRHWSFDYDLKMKEEESSEFKEGPTITEAMLDGDADQSTESQL